MSEQSAETLKVGQVVEFTGYTGLQDDVAPLFKEGERVVIVKIGKDEQQNPLFEVRPVDEGGEVMATRDGDSLFQDEFKVLEVQAKAKAKARAKAKPKAATKRQQAKAKAVEEKAATETVVEPEAKPKTTTKAKAKAKAPAKAKVNTKPKAGAKGKATTTPTVAAKPKAEVKKAATKKAGGKGKAKAAEEFISAEGYVHDAAVAELLRNSESPVEAACTLAERHEELYFLVGGVLTKIRDDATHVEAGFDDSRKGFQTYVDETIGGVAQRKAYYLMDIYTHMRQAGITSAELKGLGWTKARLLTKVPVEDLAGNKDHWLSEGREKTRTDLEATIKKSYVSATGESGETIQKKRWTFTLLGEANTLVEQAVAHAKQQVEDGDGNKAFELICTEYMNMCANVDGAATMVPETAEQLEALAEKLGLDITVNGPAE